MKQFGFARLMRLADPDDFKQAFTAGGRVSNKAFTVLYRSNSLEYPRLGMAIPRKHFSRAVDRNRIKRLVRESFRQRQRVLGGRDLVVLSKPGINRRSNSELLSCLERQWMRLVKQCSDS
ncbi:ribonuclease P protein component [Nitrosococcus watsonii]|uniref:Ribonuclease P protein component n=1 Tax=Nitrosococcus watsoni (strain C-113) TaxID=105559 RepID=D8K4Q8_NITWC|nr:ribonuclease P protein component [Nitrosococcus watsonii]ADJ29860.1 ribonuclease P protein component [Nitrosococcus watsonii C-113]